MAKLYEDEDAIDDEMKVFDMDAALSDDNEEDAKPKSSEKGTKKREEKALGKK